MTIGHREGEKFVADVVTGQAPKFNPQEVTASLAQLAREYSIRKVRGDNYSGEWVKTAWESQGFVYEKADLPASALYQECIPLFTRGHIEIPDHPGLPGGRQFARTVAGRTRDQLIIEIAGNVAAELPSPFGLGAFGVIARRTIDHLGAERRVEGGRGALHDQNIRRVLPKMLGVAFPKQAKAPVGRRDCDKHSVGMDEGRCHRAQHFSIRIAACVIPPISNFIKDAA
jgi:hypothetical protein